MSRHYRRRPGPIENAFWTFMGVVLIVIPAIVILIEGTGRE